MKKYSAGLFRPSVLFAGKNRLFSISLFRMRGMRRFKLSLVAFPTLVLLILSLAVLVGTAAKMYFVNYDGNGATSGTVPDNQLKSPGVDLTLATNNGNLAKTGYTFAGWNTAADGTGTAYAEGGTYTADEHVTLYARWTLIPTDPVIQVTPNSLNFGYVPVGLTKDLTLTVKNTGVGTLTGTASTTVPFRIVSGGSYSLGANQQQTVTIRYQPTSTGAHTGTIVFTGGGGATIPVTGKTPLGLPWLQLLLGD